MPGGQVQGFAFVAVAVCSVIDIVNSCLCVKGDRHDWRGVVPGGQVQGFAFAAVAVCSSRSVCICVHCCVCETEEARSDQSPSTLKLNIHATLYSLLNVSMKHSPPARPDHSSRTPP